MMTMMMRAGVDERDYTTPIPEWTALAAAVTNDEKNEDVAAIAHVLNGMKKDSGSSTPNASLSSEPTKEQVKARQRVTLIVNRSRYAYGLIHSAMDADLRQLIDDIPTGYAFGLWSLLEQRFQSKTDDTITDVWTQFVNLAQEDDEAFDAYMARVDKLSTLLESAGQIPASGLRKVILLYRLRPMYEQPRLALQLSGKLDVNDKIDWISVKGFMQDFERNKSRGDDPNHVNGSDRAYAVYRGNNQRRQKNGNHNDAGDEHVGSDSEDENTNGVKCFKCNKFGHIARYCKKDHTMNNGKYRSRQRDDNSSSSHEAQDENVRGDRRGNKAYSLRHAFSVQAPKILDDEEDAYDQVIMNERLKFDVTESDSDELESTNARLTEWLF